MRYMLRAALATVLALALVATAGCGSDKKEANEYVGAVNKVQTDFAASLTKVQERRSTTAKDAAQQLADVKTAIGKAVSDLQAVKPPDKVAGLHRELIGEMKQLERGIGDAAAALASRDAKSLVAAQAKLTQELGNLGTRIQATIAAINKKLRS